MNARRIYIIFSIFLFFRSFLCFPRNWDTIAFGVFFEKKWRGKNVGKNAHFFCNHCCWLPMSYFCIDVLLWLCVSLLLLYYSLLWTSFAPVFPILSVYKCIAHFYVLSLSSLYGIPVLWAMPVLCTILYILSLQETDGWKQ